MRPAGQRVAGQSVAMPGHDKTLSAGLDRGDGFMGDPGVTARSFIIRETVAKFIDFGLSIGFCRFVVIKRLFCSSAL